jgi:chromosome partitioning protein
MARVISIVNQKGGTGKTTTAINLGAALATFGKFVLLVDFDPQGNATSGLGVKLESENRGIYDVLTNNKSATEITAGTAIEGLNLLPSGPDLSGATVELVDVENREYKLKEALLEIRNNYDFIFIDCPPSLGLLTVNSLVASDDILIPVQCEYYALEGLGQLLNTIALVKENLQPDLEVLGALLTMYHKRIKLAKEVVEQVREHFPYRVFDTLIPRNVDLAEAPSFGVPIIEHAKKSAGSKAYRKLAVEILTTYNLIRNG